MTQFRAKWWACLGAAALAGACQPSVDSARSTAPPSTPPAVAVESGGAPMLTTPDEVDGFRHALMKASLTTAMKLVDEGAGSEAAPHFRRPIDDVYTPAQAAYAARKLELDTVKFTIASENAGLGKPAHDIRPMWAALNKQVDRLAPRKFSRPPVIKALLAKLSLEYSRAVQGPTVISAADYQHAYGLARVSAHLIDEAARDGQAGDANQAAELRREAETLVNMFPTASPPPNPAAPGEVQAQISRIHLAFPGME